MRRLLLLLLTLLPYIGIVAQNDDFGIWYSASVEKKLSKKCSIEAEGEFRSRNSARTVDKWTVGIEADYKLNKMFKAFVGFTFLDENNMESITSGTDNEVEKWRPSYWGQRYRLRAGIAASAGAGAFSFSLRECWQYTYRPEKTVDRYDFDDCQWEDKVIDEKNKHILRSRFRIEYNIPHCKIDPYADIETFHELKLAKIRYTVGADWRVKKKHTLGFFYRYQDINGSDDDDDTNAHIIGLSYKYKL